ncbi:hypothetical protein N7G274_010523 [Stereocaulon virgatum]|uniref:Uncharacterized protein n=1 Tax=Stereocaulon virgatum TaxID=373712 RepID=A0ABR4A075_9LECA
MHQKVIERQIITISDVYERYPCLMNLLKVNSDLACGLFQCKIAKDQRRLLSKKTLDCRTTDWKAQGLTDEEIEEIATRWRQTSYIQDRYLDRHASLKFEDLKAAYALDSWRGERA